MKSFISVLLCCTSLQSWPPSSVRSPGEKLSQLSAPTRWSFNRNSGRPGTPLSKRSIRPCVTYFELAWTSHRAAGWQLARRNYCSQDMLAEMNRFVWHIVKPRLKAEVFKLPTFRGISKPLWRKWRGPICSWEPFFFFYCCAQISLPALNQFPLMQDLTGKEIQPWIYLWLLTGACRGYGIASGPIGLRWWTDWLRDILANHSSNKKNNPAIKHKEQLPPTGTEP